MEYPILFLIENNSAIEISLWKTFDFYFGMLPCFLFPRRGNGCFYYLVYFYILYKIRGKKEKKKKDDRLTTLLHIYPLT